MYDRWVLLCSSCDGPKYLILYRVYNGIFDYLRAVVYNLYKSIFSTGAAMIQEQNVIKVLLPIEIQLTDTAFYQYAPFMQMVGVAKERRTSIGPW